MESLCILAGQHDIVFAAMAGWALSYRFHTRSSEPNSFAHGNLVILVIKGNDEIERV